MKNLIRHYVTQFIICHYDGTQPSLNKFNSYYVKNSQVLRTLLYYIEEINVQQPRIRTKACEYF